MELFHEMYGCYYHVVGRILREAHRDGVSRGEIDRIVAGEGFAESGLHLLPRLLDREWDLLREEDGIYRSKLGRAETDLPLTLLQKTWLKSLLHDRRIRLFLEDEQIAALEERFRGIEPLFRVEDFHTFDIATDGDPYEEEGYIRRFRLALSAIKKKTPLLAQYERGKGGCSSIVFLPERMLYSAKDDKFRLLGKTFRARNKTVILNLGRIQSLEETAHPLTEEEFPPKEPEKHSVRIAIYEERNALERCMLQFASYDKQTAFDDEKNCYLCDISYDPMEETELLIRILSFGPVVEVLGPKRMLEQVRRRVEMQMQRIVGPE